MTFKDDHMISLKGKDYLPVAPRVVMFRVDHPTWGIHTEPVTIGDNLFICATVCDEHGIPVATAHKQVKPDKRGPAADWPVETAETGAVGRALALCGYGTLSGDLDEGDQLADAPQNRVPDEPIPSRPGV